MIEEYKKELENLEKLIKERPELEFVHAEQVEFLKRKIAILNEKNNN